MNQLNQAAIDLIKSFEGLKLSAYPDPGSGGNPFTIGYGHTGQYVLPTSTITEPEAQDLLKQDLSDSCNSVRHLVASPINDNQFGALVSFCFNEGQGKLKSSTLLTYVNKNQFDLAAEEFPRWVHAGGKVLNGLIARRQKEKQLFLTPA